jgi:hypothetical protein
VDSRDRHMYPERYGNDTILFFLLDILFNLFVLRLVANPNASPSARLFPIGSRYVTMSGCGLKYREIRERNRLTLGSPVRSVCKASSPLCTG